MISRVPSSFLRDGDHIQKMICGKSVEMFEVSYLIRSVCCHKSYHVPLSVASKASSLRHDLKRCLNALEVG